MIYNYEYIILYILNKDIFQILVSILIALI